MAEQATPQRDQATTLRTLNRAADSGRATRVLSVTSGKGGVGKTAVVANLAVLLSRMGQRVLILDADLGLANIDVVFGLAPNHNLNHFFSGEQTLEAILVEGPEGIRILPAGSGVQRFTRLDSEQKLQLLEALDGMHNDFDFVLIDTEAGISENVTYFNTAAQEILVVTTPEPTAMTTPTSAPTPSSTRCKASPALMWCWNCVTRCETSSTSRWWLSRRKASSPLPMAGP